MGSHFSFSESSLDIGDRSKEELNEDETVVTIAGRLMFKDKMEKLVLRVSKMNKVASKSICVRTRLGRGVCRLEKILTGRSHSCFGSVYRGKTGGDH